LTETPNNLEIRKEAARRVLEQRNARESLVSWARLYGRERGIQPAAHHLYMLEKLQAAVDGTLTNKAGKPIKNLIISMPPGAAKSTYSSKIFPPWAIQRQKGTGFLACSHTADLIESFSRECRNTIAQHKNTLGYDLEQDSRSIQGWNTTNGGFYKCMGIGGAIAGRRGDVGIIDDYIGKLEDAESKLSRDKIWNWFLNDFWPRLKPNATLIIIATRWHEEDLIGRLTDPNNNYSSPISPEDWEIIRFPFFAEADDVLGRAEGERLWPEYFTEGMSTGIKLLPPRTRAGLYQQRPAPEEGNYFKREWLVPYTRSEYDTLERKIKNGEATTYGAGDWAVSEEKDANRSCFGCAALDEDKTLFLLPDIFWKVAGPKEVVQSAIDLFRRREPRQFWSEKGHISKAWGPFLKDRMVEEDVYSYITEVTPSKAKDVRARSIQGLMSMQRVKFPTFASWWPDAEHELLTFPGGKTDDFVDFLAHLGAGITSMLRGTSPRKVETYDLNKPQEINLTWIKKSSEEAKRATRPKYADR
jgi:hypothetical protein